MRKTRRTTSRRSTSRRCLHFKISETSRETLYRAREHLLLLASLCAARVRYDATELELSPDALLTCFQRAADDLGAVLDETRYRPE